MNNSNADQALKDCDAELIRIENYINKLGSTNPISGCLTQYALIRISATLEVCYKTIIADFYESLSPHFSRFIFHHVRDANMNATFDNICTTLSRFDETKKNSFKTQVHGMANKDLILHTFSEINKARNDVAHGQNTTLTFNDLKSKFLLLRPIMEILDSVMR